MKGTVLARLASARQSRRHRRSIEERGWMPIETQLVSRPEVRRYNY